MIHFFSYSKKKKKKNTVQISVWRGRCCRQNMIFWFGPVVPGIQFINITHRRFFLKIKRENHLPSDGIQTEKSPGCQWSLQASICGFFGEFVTCHWPKHSHCQECWSVTKSVLSSRNRSKLYHRVALTDFVHQLKQSKRKNHFK